MPTDTAPTITRAERDSAAPAGFIALCEPHLDREVWDYVRDCLDSNWVSSVGPYVERFEKSFAAYLGLPHAVAAVNGTAALHVALLACGVAPDDEVLMPTLTFIAPANAVRYCNAWPVFFDVDPATWQLDVALVARFLREDCTVSGGAVTNRKSGRRVRAILPVHLLGHPVDMDPLVALAREYELKIVEDATESLGGLYKDKPIGVHGDVACFSFNGNKIITTGGGGMIVCADAAIAERAFYLTTQAKDDPIEYVHNEIGFDYRLTNVQAAMGCAQLERLGFHGERKRAIAARYRAELNALPGLDEAPWARSAFWLYTIRTERPDSRVLLRTLAAKRIQARPLWQPLHQSRAHKGAAAVTTGVAEAIHATALSLPSSVGLTESDQGRVIAAVREACAAGSG